MITAPENVAWTLNIRGGDNPISPIPNSYLFIDKYENFFDTEKSKAKKIIEEKVITKSQLIELNKIKNFLETIKLAKY